MNVKTESVNFRKKYLRVNNQGAIWEKRYRQKNDYKIGRTKKMKHGYNGVYKLYEDSGGNLTECYRDWPLPLKLI